MLIFHSSVSLPEGTFFFFLLPTAPTLPRRGATKIMAGDAGTAGCTSGQQLQTLGWSLWDKKNGNTTHKRSRIVWGLIFVCQFCSFGKLWYIKNDLSKKYQQQC